jgi:hypothetical protein
MVNMAPTEILGFDFYLILSISGHHLLIQWECIDMNLNITSYDSIII